MTVDVAVGLGAEEFITRVSKYEGKNLDIPTEWQALVKHRKRNKPWGVGVDVDPKTAMLKAITSFITHNTETPTVRVRQRKRPAPTSCTQ